MRHVTDEDLKRTRALLRELGARQDRLGAALATTGLTDFVARAEWLAARRTPDEQLAWVRRWKRLPTERIVRPVAVPKPPRMTGAEVIEELDWLRSNGASPWEAAEAMRRTAASLSKLAYRWGRPDLAVYIDTRRAA